MVPSVKRLRPWVAAAFLAGMTASVAPSPGVQAAEASPSKEALPRYLDLVWNAPAGAEPVVVEKDFFVNNPSAVPGDQKDRAMVVKNAASVDGVLVATLIDTRTLLGQGKSVSGGVNFRAMDPASVVKDPFFNDLMATWNTSWGGPQARQFSKMPKEIPLGSMVLKAGQTTAVTFGYDYRDFRPYNNQVPRGEKRQASYRVKLSISGETPPPGAPVQSLSLKIIPKLLDRDGDGKADRGEKILWTFQVTNTGKVPVKDLQIVSQYLKGHGVTARCPSAPLAPGGTVTCTATTIVNADDMKRDSIILTAHAQGNGVVKSPRVAGRIISSLQTATVPLDTPRSTPLNPEEPVLPPEFPRDTPPRTIDQKESPPFVGIVAGELQTNPNRFLAILGGASLLLGFIIALFLSYRRRRRAES